MRLKAYLRIFVFTTLSISLLNANDYLQDNCLLESQKKDIGCSVANILEEHSQTFQIREEKPIHVTNNKQLELNITTTLRSIKVKHQKEEVLIKRHAKNNEHTCPPFCIQPMSINNIHAVGEVEVLEFIKTLKEKKSKLLIDARSSTLYKISTIPGAINIPYSMLKNKSKYQKKVLELLGATQHHSSWLFKKVPTLLIFGNSEEENQATQAIRSLLKLAYPAHKLHYYRGGVASWKRLGLTLY
jgi:rhodanese-related sulfurtransferase